MDGFKRLEEVGSKNISAATHIPIAHVEKILSKSYTHFQKPQFFGFISILEREYKIDLAQLKQEYLFTLAEKELPDESSFDMAESGFKFFENSGELLKNKKVTYGAGAIAGIVLVLFLVSLIDFSSSDEVKIEINNSAIDKAKKNLNIKPVVPANVEEALSDNTVESAEFGQDQQAAKEQNSTATEEKGKETTAASEPMMPLYFRIVPKGRLWLGIINAETHRRRVETISKPLILDAEKSWLIVTGYGHLDLDCGDTTTKLREDNKLLILYENGICQVIDKEEFKARNRGKLW